MPSPVLLSTQIALSVFALALTAHAAPFIGDDPPPSAESILDRMDQACGDVQKRAALKSLRLTGSANVPGMSKPFEFVEVYLGADRFKQTMFAGKDEGFTMGSTGTNSWSTDPAMGVTVRAGDEQLGTLRWFAFGRRAPWRTLYEKAELLGVADVDGDDCWKLRMIPKAGTDANWYVDQASLLPRKIDVKVPDPGGGDDAPLSWTYEDWKAVDGILFPQSKTMHIAGMAITYRYKTIEPNADVTEEEIAPAEDVKQAIAHPKPVMKAGEVTIETIEPQQVLIVRAKVKEADLSKELARLLPEVGKSAAIADMAGPPFTRYLTHGGDEIEIETGIPVKKKLAGAGRVTASELPGGRVAMTWHVGPYGDLKKTHTMLETWMKEHNVEAAGGPWEIYWTDPGMEPDPAKWRTQIYWPIK